MSEHVLANGIKMAYRFDGSETAPVVLLSNSLMSNLSMWDPQMAALTRSFRVLRYDTRGHGATEATPGPYSIKLLTEDAIALLDALGIDKVHFAGLSMGGMIAQYAGAKFPERVLSLLLCDTASEMPTQQMWNDRMATAQEKGIAAMVEPTLKRWFTAPYLASKHPDLDKVAEMIRSTSLVGYVGCASAVRDMSQTGLLSSIKAPTVIIVGEDDPACTVAQSQVLQEQIDGSSLVIIKEAAHLANIEQIDAFNEAMMTFLMSR